MLDSMPEETTQLLIDLCTLTGSLDVPEPEVASPILRSDDAKTGPSYLSYLALNRNALAAPALTTDEHVVDPRSPNVAVRVPPPQPPTRDASSVRSGSPPPAAPAPPPPVPIKRLSPRLYFAHFVDHMPYFVIFLETVASRRWNQSVDKPQTNGATPSPPPPLDEEADQRDQVAVWNTLLELYLTLSSGALQSKALLILRRKDLPYDPTHALILCSSQGYTPGLVHLWESMNMQEDVLRYYMDLGDTRNVVDHLNTYGKTRPHLYPLVLRWLTKTPAILAETTKDVENILEHIERERIMHPLGVVQLLSRNGVASIGLVKAWLMTRIKESREEIETDQQLITSYRLETAAKLKQVKELGDEKTPKVFHSTRCSSCLGQLDLPSIHFMCDHSYHQRYVYPIFKFSI